MRQILALASMIMLVAIVLSGCVWVPVDREGHDYYGGSHRGFDGSDRDHRWDDRDGWDHRR
jgi:hypothetical protein